MTDRGSLLPFHTYLWKVASRCNLDCTYCYVYNSVDARWREQPAFMSEAVARQTARRMREHLDGHGKSDASIVFHGGEPLLGGVELFTMLTDVIREAFAGSGIRLTVGTQSNLLLFDASLGDLMMERGVSIGVSLDGPPAINDRYRIDHLGQPSSARLEQQLVLLTSGDYRRAFSGFLCVIDPDADPSAVTEYLLSFNPPSIDFLFPLHNHDRPPRRMSADATPYGDWLVASYDYWMSHPNETRIRMFQNIMGLICGQPSLVESLGLTPVDLVVIETNGALESVDCLKTAYEGATVLGFNVFDHTFDAAARHLMVQSRQLGADGLCEQCQACPMVGVCGGGYLPTRYAREGGFDHPSVYCRDLQRIISHIYDSVWSTVRTLEQLRPPEGHGDRIASSHVAATNR
jgi:uncharacterized protein